MPRMALLNSPLCPNPGTFTLSEPVTSEEARAHIEGATLDSFVGHAATAAALAVLLGQPVETRRAECRLASGESAVVLSGRLPEGAVLSADELAAVGYTLHILRRVA